MNYHIPLLMIMLREYHKWGAFYIWSANHSRQQQYWSYWHGLIAPVRPLSDIPSRMAAFRQQLLHNLKENTTKDKVFTLPAYFTEPLSSFPKLQHVAHSEVPNKSQRASLSQQLTPVRDETLWACDSIAVVHLELQQLLHKFQNAKRDIRIDYNCKRLLAHLPPIQFYMPESYVASTTPPKSFHDICSCQTSRN